MAPSKQLTREAGLPKLNTSQIVLIYQSNVLKIEQQMQRENNDESNSDVGPLIPDLPQLECCACLGSSCIFINERERTSGSIPKDLIRIESVKLELIAIDDEGIEVYCQGCLQKKIADELAEVKGLEERFIYFKEFESSYDESCVSDHQHQIQLELQEEEKQINFLQQKQNKLNEELQKMKEETIQLKEKILSMELQQQKFWDSINKIEKRSSKLEQKSLNSKFDRNETKDILEQLGQTSAIHLFLDIKIEDNLGFIQNLPMGKRTQNTDINWDDIAVGLGHLLLALNVLTLKYSYEWQRIEKIIFCGCYSEIILKLKKRPYSLFYNKQNEKLFGELMETLLLQLFYLSQHILSVENIEYSEEYKLPFTINLEQFKIVDLFIDPTKFQDRTRWNAWTKAMRYFLVDFNHTLTVYAICDQHL